MATDHKLNPRGPTPPSYDNRLLGTGQGCNVVEGLEGAVDGIRQIASDIGARPYKYHSVTVRWSGGEIGNGEPSVIREVEILPTPKTEPAFAINRTLENAGVDERGDIILTGVSPRYTEDEIDVLFGAYRDPENLGDETFIEQRIDDRDGITRRRRFILARMPERRATRLDWRITLRRAEGERLRSGQPRAERERVWR